MKTNNTTEKSKALELKKRSISSRMKSDSANSGKAARTTVVETVCD